MRNLILALAATSILAACGSKEDPRKVLVDSCMAEAEGATQEGCDCVTDAMVDNLNEDEMAQVVKAIKGGGDTDAFMEDFMGKLMTDPERQEAGMAMGTAMMSCMMEME